MNPYTALSGCIVRGTTALLVATLLPACLVNTELYEERRAALSDADGDGVSVAEGDCDDANARVFPGAAELCNGFDDNCAGGADEIDPGNDTLWAADADADGFASDDATPYAACVSPGAGWVSVFGDCDDTNAEVWPGAPEACDGLDNDCDAAADEEPTVDPPAWYPDTDGDGFGGPDEGVAQCLPPSTGWVTNDTDCSDEDAERRPDALERCNGLDDDCDGEADEPPLTETGGWYPDHDGDGYGDAAGASCTAGEGYVTSGGDCDDTNTAVNPSATEVCNDTLDNDCDGSPNACTWSPEVDLTTQLRISSLQYDEVFGYMGGTGDLDGEGGNEIVFSSATGYRTSPEVIEGAVRIFTTPITRDLTTDDAVVTFWGEHHRSGAGSSILVHDLDGDGIDDLQIGAAIRTVDGQENAGTLFTFFGPVTEGGVLPEVADGALVGVAEEGIGSRAYAFGDLDGDGLPDFGTGYEFQDYLGRDRNGRLYVFTSSSEGTELASEAATAVLYGSESYDEIGLTATGLDIDADGINDVVVGAQGYDEGANDGAALVFFGPVHGSIAGDDADVFFTAEGPTHYAGRAVETLGDINGDGVDDLLVGAPYASSGSAYILWGDPAVADRGLADADVTFRADRSESWLGYSVRGLGDLDGDGVPDLFLSERVQYDEAANGYVFFGPFDSPAVYRSGDANVTLAGGISDAVYETAFTPGDATGDGVSDLVLGSYQHGAEAWDGVVYIVAGIGL